MDYNSDRERAIRSLRGMAWERAKGELMAMQHTFWGDHPNFPALSAAVKDFIKHIEDEGLHE